MAIVARTLVVRLWWKDNDGAESFSLVNLPSSTAISSALSFATSWRGLASAISTAFCFGYDLIIRFAENTVPAAGGASDTDRRGVFIFGDDPGQLAVVRVPSIDLALLESSGPYAGIRIDQTNTDIAAIIDALCNGLAGVQPCDPFGNDITLISQAYKEQF